MSDQFAEEKAPVNVGGERPFNPDCPCKNVGCSRHGHCDECLAHHAGGGPRPCGKEA